MSAGGDEALDLEAPDLLDSAPEVLRLDLEERGFSLEPAIMDPPVLELKQIYCRKRERIDADVF